MRRLAILLTLVITVNCFALQKNVASQKWVVFAFDETDNTAKTGDAGNITANVRIDGGAANAVDDTNPTELEDGYYIFDLSQAETNGDYILICPASTTADIQVIGCPMATWTTPAYFPSLSIDSNGRLDIIKIAGTSQTANDNGADINTLITGVNLTKINGSATNGNNATLSLKQLNIQNDSGNALIAYSTGGNGHGILAAGNGSGSGTASTGGATGYGIIASGGSTSGAGIFSWAQGNNDAGMQLVKHGTGKDIDADEIDAILTDTSTTLDNYVDDLETRLTAARAGYLDELAAANIPSDIDAILTDTGTTLDNLVDDLETRLTAARAGYLDELAAANIPSDVDAILADTGTAGVVVAAVNADAIEAGDFKTGAIDADALATDFVTEIWAKAMSDLASGAPSATASVHTAINWLYEAWRNKTVTNGTDSEVVIYKDDGSTKLVEADISDDGTDFTRGEMGAPD